MSVHLVLYLSAFAGIWIGSGLAMGSVEKLSRILKASSFTVSFLVLGLFTSMGEFSVGINSILRDDPEIYVGNLIGASIVIFMLIVPILAIMGNSIRVSPVFQGFNLPASLVVISLPVILAMDGRIGRTDSLTALVFFGILVMAVQTKRGLWEKIKSFNARSGLRVGRELLKIVFGLATIFIASRVVVEQTIYFSQLFEVSPFILSLLVIAIGTNIPELSFAVRSAFMRNNQIAFGDYIGSASFNTFLLGFLTLVYGKPVILTNSYLVSLLFLIVGLALFYYFARTKNTISRGEGLVLLGVYVAFVATEVIMHKGLIMGW